MDSKPSVVRIAFHAADPCGGRYRGKRTHNGASTLRTAAKLVENIAYSEAGDQPTAIISQRIIVSADLERLA